MIRSIAKALLSLAVRRRWPRLEGVAIGLLLRWHAEQPARDAAQLEADEQLEARLLGMRSDTIDVAADRIARRRGLPPAGLFRDWRE
jgi:hypothetical protein